MNLSFNKELVSKTLLLFGGVVLTISLGRCAYNYYSKSHSRDDEKNL